MRRLAVSIWSTRFGSPGCSHTKPVSPEYRFSASEITDASAHVPSAQTVLTAHRPSCLIDFGEIDYNGSRPVAWD